VTEHQRARYFGNFNTDWKAEKVRHKVQQKDSARELLEFFSTAEGGKDHTYIWLAKDFIMTSNPSSIGKTGRKGKRRTASATTGSAEEYKVGPGRPPKDYRFKPGRSGNPKGAKPKPASLVPDLKRLFEQALGDKVRLKQGDKEQTLTMAEAGIKQLVAQFAKGDRHARRDVFAYAEKLGVDLMASHRQDIEKALASDHRAILDAYVARQREGTAPSTSAPVFAPSELLDDDVTGEG
jgi:Family of unknown function (DUF5681)